MARVFVVGMSLPKFHPSERIVAGSYRTEQIVEPIAAAGHELRVCASNYFTKYGRKPYVGRMRRSPFEYVEMNFLMTDQREDLKKCVADFEPDCIVAVSQMPAHFATGFCGELPLWCDLYGAVMAEAQAKAHVYKDNSAISHFWNMEKHILLRGDRFSTCGMFQEHFVTGELALMGRLSRETFGYHFAHPIPPGIPSDGIKTPEGKVIRGKHVDDGDFVILWAGGYNTWTDVTTLFKALEKVFAENSRAKFVSFGGCIDGHDDLTYKRFCKLIAKSRFKSRYILLGWQNREDVLRAYRESDIGLNIDSYHYELVFGTRTRLVEMIALGLPVITTVGCELSYEIRDEGLGLTFEIGDFRGMAESLLEFGGDLENARRRYSEKALSYFLEHYTYEKACQPLLRWLEDPKRAPDFDFSARPSVAQHGDGALEHSLLEAALRRLTSGEDEAAGKLLEAYVELYPSHVPALYHLGSVRKRLGDPARALTVFERAYASARKGKDAAGTPLLGGIYFHIGECCFLLGQTEKASRHFKKCLSRIPGHNKASEYLKRIRG